MVEEIQRVYLTKIMKFERFSLSHVQEKLKERKNTTEHTMADCLHTEHIIFRCSSHDEAERRH